jgi:hypothetical protein
VLVIGAHTSRYLFSNLLSAAIVPLTDDSNIVQEFGGSVPKKTEQLPKVQESTETKRNRNWKEIGKKRGATGKKESARVEGGRAGPGCPDGQAGKEKTRRTTSVVSLPVFFFGSGLATVPGVSRSPSLPSQIYTTACVS